MLKTVHEWLYYLVLCIPGSRKYLRKINKEVKSGTKNNKDKNLESWKQIYEMPGGDQNPFEIPVGPTKMCLSAIKLVSFVEDGEKDKSINQHLDDCKECLDRVSRFKSVR